VVDGVEYGGGFGVELVLLEVVGVDFVEVEVVDGVEYGGGFGVELVLLEVVDGVE